MSHTIKIWKILIFLIIFWILSLGYRILIKSVKDEVISKTKQEIIETVKSDIQDSIDRELESTRRDLEYQIICRLDSTEEKGK